MTASNESGLLISHEVNKIKMCGQQWRGTIRYFKLNSSQLKYWFAMSKQKLFQEIIHGLMKT